MEAKKITTIKEKLNIMLDLPRDLLINLPRITIIGFQDLLIENYKNIISYEPTEIKISTTEGIMEIAGEGLYITELSKENILIKGRITAFEFTR